MINASTKFRKTLLVSSSCMAHTMQHPLISRPLTCQLARSWRTHRPLIRITTAAVRPLPDSRRICSLLFGGCTEAAPCWLSADFGLELASSQRRRGVRKPQACPIYPGKRTYVPKGRELVPPDGFRTYEKPENPKPRESGTWSSVLERIVQGGVAGEPPQRWLQPARGRYPPYYRTIPKHMFSFHMLTSVII